MSKKTSPIATSQRRIIIIGATSGIGREVAQIYIAQGHIVGLAARRYKHSVGNPEQQKKYIHSNH